MRPIDRLEESFAGVVNARALIAIIDGQVAIEDVAKKRHLVEMPAGLAARRQRDQRRGDERRAGRVGNVLAENRLAVGDNGGEQRLIQPGGRSRLLPRSRRNEQRRDRDRGRAGHTQTKHAQSPSELLHLPG
jgi:hypothetical protein